MNPRPSTADFEFVLLTLASSVATFADVESTKYAQRDPDAVEFNSWIYGERPSSARMYAVSIPLTAAFAYAAYCLKKKYPLGRHAWAWRLPLLGLSVGHSLAAIANIVNFCPSAEAE